MLLDCPACARSYHVSRDEIGEGRSVICPRCDAHWYVDRDGTSATGPAANDLLTSSISMRPSRDDGAARRRAPARRLSVWQRIHPAFVSGACLLVAIVAIGSREQVVRLAPRTAGFYASIGLPVNLRGLEFAEIRPDRPASAPSDLTISGSIHNVAHKRVSVPRLTYQVRDAAGAPLMAWTETAPSKTLAAGKTLPFVSSPRALPPNGHSILVRFEEDGDAPIRLAGRTN